MLSDDVVIDRVKAGPEAYEIRQAQPSDQSAIAKLYRQAAFCGPGLAREAYEMDDAYFADIAAGVERSGVQLVATAADSRIVGELHAHRFGIRVFEHVLSNLTMCVDPNWRRCRIGFRLFESLFDYLRVNEPDVSRLELFVRESNSGAIGLYQRLGFEIEGVLKGRIAGLAGELENDLIMARVVDCRS